MLLVSCAHAALGGRLDAGPLTVQQGFAVRHHGPADRNLVPIVDGLGQHKAAKVWAEAAESVTLSSPVSVR